MTKAFINASIFTADKELTGFALLIQNERVLSLVPEREIPADTTLINLQGKFIAPSFIDLQVYGGGGYLFSNEPSVIALEAMTNALNTSGTGYFLPTLATNSFDIISKSVEVLKVLQHPSIGGLHLEGPYINLKKKGAHLEKYIRKPKLDEIKRLLEDADGMIRMMTLAPELVNADIIRLLNDHGVLVSAGHSNCSFEEGIEGFKNGVRLTTHLFNAMSPMHHRDTGLPGATFLSENVSASIIADGIHVDYATVSISKKILRDRLFLITDAVEENNEGVYIHLKKEDRFTLDDDTLSGSRLTMLQAVKNCVQYCGIELAEALRMASLYPANITGMMERGRLVPGAFADFIVFDKTLSLQQVYLHGKLISN